MRWFYAFWFFFCAAWGSLLAQPFPGGFEARSVPLAVASLPVGAITFFLALSVELWRLGANRKVPKPSLTLKPWNMPIGFTVFILLTFLFTGIWGVAIAAILDNGHL